MYRVTRTQSDGAYLQQDFLYLADAQNQMLAWSGCVWYPIGKLTLTIEEVL